MARLARSAILPLAMLVARCSDGSTPARDASTEDIAAQDVPVADARATDAAQQDAITDGRSSDVPEVDAAVDSGPSCTGIHAPPAGLRRQTSFSLATNSQLWASSNTEWPRNAVLDLTTWNPAPMGQRTMSGLEKPTLGLFARNPGDTATIEIETGAYAALRIETAGLAGRAGALNSEMPGSMGAPFVLAISRCPGDFQPESPTCRTEVSGLASIGWTTATGPATFCRLEPGATYYLNVMFADPASPSMSTCSFSRCWWLVSSGCSAGC